MGIPDSFVFCADFMLFLPFSYFAGRDGRDTCTITISFFCVCVMLFVSLLTNCFLFHGLLTKNKTKNVELRQS